MVQVFNRQLEKDMIMSRKKNTYEKPNQEVLSMSQRIYEVDIFYYKLEILPKNQAEINFTLGIDDYLTVHASYENKYITMLHGNQRCGLE